MLSRRALLSSAAALPALPMLSGMARAAAHENAPALPDATRFTIGDMHVTTLSDGTLRIGPEALQGIDAAGYADLMQAQFRDPDTFAAAINAFLIEAGGQKMLIDAGTGGAFGPTTGTLAQNLAATGTDPADITMLLITHLHGDHIGGTVADGQAVFQNAQFAVSGAERDFWTDDAMMARAGEGAAGAFGMARAALDAYADRLVIYGDAQEVAPGITAMALPGHTPGHSGFNLTSGDQAVLVWADIIHVPPVQFARPEVTIGFDVDPALAAETRAAILDRVTADRMLVAGSHMGFPGFAHIEKAAMGYRNVDAPYPYNG